jgi:insulysin
MNFRFKDKEKPRSLTCSVAGLLFDFPVEDVISGSYILYEFRPDLIEDVISRLTPDNVRIAVIGRKYEGTTDKVEPWYGTHYSVNRIPDSTIDAWRNAGTNDTLRLPEKNEFIPTDFKLVSKEEGEVSPVPTVVYNSPYGRMWFKQDDKFLLPKASLNFELRSPFAYTDPLSVNLNFLFVSLFQDALNEWTYAADIAGLGYSLENSIYGLYLGVRGKLRCWFL